MPQEFNLSDEVLTLYQALRYRKGAQLKCNYIPMGTMYWADEHPKGWLPRKCDERSKEVIYRLLDARIAYWHTGEIPVDLEILWIEANAAIPDWPGFQRMELNDDQKRFLKNCEEASEDIFMGFFEEADTVGVAEDKEGKLNWSFTFSLEEKKKNPPKKQWWRFWRKG